MKELMRVLATALLVIGFATLAANDASAQECAGCEDGGTDVEQCLLGCGTDGSDCGDCYSDEEGLCWVFNAGDCEEMMTLLINPAGNILLPQASSFVASLASSQAIGNGASQTVGEAGPDGSIFRRRLCDGVVIARTYSAAKASEMRTGSLLITL